MMVSGGFGLRGLVQYTNWRRNIASVNWGMGAWSRIGGDHHSSVVPACESTQLGAGAQLYSQLAQLLPCVITGLATLDTCGVLPQVVP